MTADATTGKNAAAVRRSIEAYNAGDVGRMLDMAHPDIEWEVVRQHPAATTHRGHDAVREYLADWQSTLDDIRMDIQSLRANGDIVVTVCRVRGQGAESGAAVEVEIAFVTTFRDGKAIRVAEFFDPDEAMRALSAGPTQA